MLQETDKDFRIIYYEVSESDLVLPGYAVKCPRCGGELAWYCEQDRQDDPRLPPPCGCNDGHCKCDRFICLKCREVVDVKAAGKRPRYMNDKLVIP